MLLKTLLATFCVVGVVLADQSPVFLWGANSLAKPALHTVDEPEFAELIAPLLKDHMIVAFQEDSLSSSDFLCSNAETSQSCYAYLQGVSEKTYYASVENPTEALRAVTDAREFNSVGQSGELATPIECAAGKVVFVSFEDAEAVRGSKLEAHDAAISAISQSIDCPAVFLYMSAPSSEIAVPSRKRRDTAATVGGYLFRQDSQLLLFYTNLYINSQEIIVTSMTVSNTSDSELSVSLATTGGTPLTFGLYLSAGYYTMLGVTYGSIQFINSSISAPTSFSYFCGNLTLTSYDTVSSTETITNTLTWNSFQFQAPFGNTDDPNFIFGDAWHCVGFFSPGILSGLFVVVLMLVILFVGVCWIMDINTMDRFDDPKGKTITINASE